MPKVCGEPPSVARGLHPKKRNFMHAANDVNMDKTQVASPIR
jgi:hypothetical protein